MIKRIFLLSFLLFFSMNTYSQDYLNRYEYMSLDSIKKKWGTAQFSEKKFRLADESEKAKMAYSLIQSKIYVGKPIKTVFKDLGRSTGYFFSESVPTYIIGDINEKSDELWQIVFLLSKDSKIISEVKVQKKCCYNQ